jgi:regulator of sigma E protease
VAIAGHPVKSWQDVSLEVLTAPTNRLAVTLERDGVRSEIFLTAKKSEKLGLKWLDLEPLERPIVGAVSPNMPAAAAGVQRDDRLISFGGVFLMNNEHLSELVAKSAGKAAELVVERAGKPVSFNLTPVFDNELKRWRIGIAFAAGHYEIQRPGPTPFEQIGGVIHLMGRTVSAVFHSKETGVGAKDMSGPVGILGKLAVDVKTDFRLALSFMVMLNLNLAILNLMPLPVLDGGHILMAAYEIVTRRRVSVRFQEYATTTFALLLLSFMLYVTVNDVTRRLPLLRSLLSQESVVDSQPASGR